ncbi:HoxN/HupN/NixA family nickel/cobalt transporter [Acetobacteraceae bacterium]|nr:HoxN/HupN/NixA family nickel/cobalt transporter [Acetobacteraceae bacterium]
MLKTFITKTDKRAFLLLLLLVMVNLAVWSLALSFFSPYPALLASALLAYGFGLRHAVDADHIAAIDNVTRKLMQQGQVPVGVGAFFSLGHSTIVILACAAIAATSLHFASRMDWLHLYGGIIGTLVSAVFLLGMALFNGVIFYNLFRNYKQLQRTKNLSQEKLSEIENASPTGLLGWIYRSVFKSVTQSWQMYFVGFLFGLGFDTASEVGLLGISASGVQANFSIWSIMIFPALFASGMALVDSLDNFVMIGAYGWAFKNPLRKLYYNMAITFISAFIALIIGGLEALGLLVDQFNFTGQICGLIGKISDQLGWAGYGVIILFVLLWTGSLLYYRTLKQEEPLLDKNTL